MISFNRVPLLICAGSFLLLIRLPTRRHSDADRIRRQTLQP